MSAVGRRPGAAAYALLIGGLAIIATMQGRPVMAQRSFDAAPARPGEIAVREEFEAARRAGTAAAYDLFIARHPDHALAETARLERERLARETGSRPGARSKP
jgi:hypothetical protein